MKFPLYCSLLPALTITLASSAFNAQAVVLFDGISDVTLPTGTGSVPRTFMGEAVALDEAAFSAALNQISSFEVAVANFTGAAITAPLRLNTWVYQTFNPAAAAPAGVFSNQIGTPGSPSFVSDFGTLTLGNSSLVLGTINLSSPVTITPTTGSVIGIVFSWQVDQGAGFVNLAGLTTVLHGGGVQPPPSVGTNVTGPAPNFGYYRNAAGETDGNFLASSVRNIGTNSGLYVRISGPDPIPEPATTILGAVFGLTLLRRRR